MSEESTRCEVAVVTVTYNSGGVLLPFLDTLARQNASDLHLIVVDNASDDASLSIVDSFSERLRIHVIQNPTNTGVAYANNQGIKLARLLGATYVILMNNDTFTDDCNAISKLVETSSSSGDGPAVYTPVIAATDPPDTVWYAGGRIHDWRGFQVKHVGMGQCMNGLPKGRWKTDYAPTCCLLVPQVVFDEVGLMDEGFFVYGDDVDFSLRLRSRGIDTWVVGNVRLEHKASSLTGGFLSDFTVIWLTRNWMRVSRKHGSLAQMTLGYAYFMAWSLARLCMRREGLRTYLMRQTAAWRGMSGKPHDASRGSSAY